MVLAVGCDSKSDEVKLGDFGQQSANAVCDKVYECCSLTDTELMAHMGYSGGRAACGTKNKDSMGFWRRSWARSRSAAGWPTIPSWRIAVWRRSPPPAARDTRTTSCWRAATPSSPRRPGRLALQGQRVLHRRQLHRQQPRQGGCLPGVRHREHLVRRANLRQGPALRWQQAVRAQAVERRGLQPERRLPVAGLQRPQPRRRHTRHLRPEGRRADPLLRDQRLLLRRAARRNGGPDPW